MPERIDDPSFKLNDEAINKVYGQDDFSFAGHIYHKSGGDTFREYGEIPGATVRLAPDEAARLNAQRIQNEAGSSSPQIVPDTRPKYRKPTEDELKDALDSPVLPGVNILGNAIIGGTIGGLPGAGAGAAGAIWNGTPGWMRENVERNLKIPIIENMTPDEIGEHFGRP